MKFFQNHLHILSMAHKFRVVIAFRTSLSIKNEPIDQMHLKNFFDSFFPENQKNRLLDKSQKTTF